jgi:hypothetical protein
MNRKPYIPIEILLLMEKNKTFTFTFGTEKPPKQVEPPKKKTRGPVQIREITTEPPPMLIITSEIVPAGWETIT